MIFRKFSWSVKFVFLFLSLIISTSTANYSSCSAVEYADLWWNTDLLPIGSPDGFVDHVNSPTYAWYDFTSTPNSGDGTVKTSFGKDCANFVSQCLIRGGLVLNARVARPLMCIKKRSCATVPRTVSSLTVGKAARR